MPIKTFRGLLADQTQQRIRLSTKKGKVGYRIVKFQILPNAPGTIPFESVVKVFKNEQTTLSGTIDFSDGNLLAAAYGMGNQGSDNTDNLFDIIFEQEIFNQDIFVTNYDVDTGMGQNYYLELEVINLSSNSAEYTTLKDVRARNTRTHGVMP